MSRRLLLLGWLLAALPAAALDLTPDSRLTIVRTGPAAAELVLAEELLARYLPTLLSPAALTPPAPGPPPVLPLTQRADALVWSQLPRERLASLADLDGFTIAVTDTPPAITISGATLYGVTCGAQHLLEHDFGVTWLFPGPLGTVIPAPRPIVLPAGERRLTPAVFSRFYTGLQYPDPDQNLPFRRRFGEGPLYGERHFFAAYDYFKSLRLHLLAAPSHNLINLFPADTTPRDYPHLMPLLPDGSRYRPPLPRPEAGNRHQNWHPCYSHPQAAELAIAAARRAFAQGELCYSLGINDGLRVQCACPDCLAHPWPAPYYRFVTTVANALADAYPPHLVGVLVYGDVRQPPADLRLPPNVFALVTTGSRLSDWAPHARHLGRYAYAYGSGFAIPSLPLKAMAHNARVDRAAGVESFRAETLPVWAYDAPKLYLQSKLLWDPGYDLQAGLDHFCRAAYGPAGPPVAAFFRQWAAHWDYLVPDDASPDPAPLCDMARWRSPAAQLGPVPDALWQDAARLLDDARPLLATPDQRARFAMLDTTFARGRTQAEILRTVAAMTSPELPAPQLVAELLALGQRDADLAATLAAHPEWQLGTSEYDALAAYWNVPQQLAAALLTALVRLRQQAPLAADLAAQLPPELAPLAQAAAQPAPPPLVEVSPDGVYWARADLTYRFAAMTATASGATLTATLARAPAVITEGSQAGDFAEHWAYALAPVRLDPDHRVLYQIELTATGRDGNLALSLTNPWRTQPGDGLPVGFSLPLTGQPQRRVLIVEPVTADSARKLGPEFAMRLGLLFSPTAATAACTVQVTLSTLLLPLPAPPPPAEDLGP